MVTGLSPYMAEKPGCADVALTVMPVAVSAAPTVKRPLLVLMLVLVVLWPVLEIDQVTFCVA